MDSSRLRPRMADESKNIAFQSDVLRKIINPGPIDTKSLGKMLRLPCILIVSDSWRPVFTTSQRLVRVNLLSSLTDLLDRTWQLRVAHEFLRLNWAMNGHEPTRSYGMKDTRYQSEETLHGIGQHVLHSNQRTFFPTVSSFWHRSVTSSFSIF